MAADSRSRELAAVTRAAERLTASRELERVRREALADAFVAAVDAGFTVREIGDAAGVSGQYVSQTYRNRKDEEGP